MNRLIPACAIAALVSCGVALAPRRTNPSQTQPAPAAQADSSPPQTDPTPEPVQAKQTLPAAIVAHYQATKAQLHAEYVAELESRPMFEEETPAQAQQVALYFAKLKALEADLKAQLGQEGYDRLLNQQQSQNEAQARAWLVSQVSEVEADLALAKTRKETWTK